MSLSTRLHFSAGTVIRKDASARVILTVVDDQIAYADVYYAPHLVQQGFLSFWDPFCFTTHKSMCRWGKEVFPDVQSLGVDWATFKSAWQQTASVSKEARLKAIMNVMPMEFIVDEVAKRFTVTPGQLLADTEPDGRTRAIEIDDALGD